MPKSDSNVINIKVKAELIDGASLSDEQLASAGLEKNKDLLYASLVLCHANVNSNKDEFEEEDLSSSFGTIKLKPVNWEHDDDEIIGTVYDSEFVDDEKDEDPFIRAFAVIYKYKFPERAEEMKKRHSEGELFFSMEVWFESATCSECGANYPDPKDYCEHLRGRFENQSFSRKLKGLTFGGVGVVENPADKGANSLSVAKITRPDGTESCFNCPEEINVMDINLLEMVRKEEAEETKRRALWIFNDALYVLLNDENISDENKSDKFSELATQLFEIYELEQNNSGGKKVMSDNVFKTFQTEEDYKNSVAQSDTVKALEAKIAEFEEIEARVTELEKSLETANDEKIQVETEFVEYKDELEKEKLISTRVKELIESGLAEDKIDDKLKTAISKLDDDEFNALKGTFVKSESDEEEEEEEGATGNEEDQKSLNTSNKAKAKAGEFKFGDFLKKI